MQIYFKTSRKTSRQSTVLGRSLRHINGYYIFVDYNCIFIPRCIENEVFLSTTLCHVPKTKQIVHMLLLLKMSQFWIFLYFWTVLRVIIDFWRSYAVFFWEQCTKYIGTPHWQKSWEKDIKLSQIFSKWEYFNWGQFSVFFSKFSYPFCRWLMAHFLKKYIHFKMV